VAIIIFGDHGWRWAFLTESILLGGVVGITYLLIPSRYFETGKEKVEEKVNEERKKVRHVSFNSVYVGC